MPIQFRKSFLLAFLGLSLSLAPAQTGKQLPKESPSSAASMTGCVDEQNGSYVLVKGPEMKVAATLEADGFPPEGFAKFVGHTITIRGTLVSNGNPPLFKVRSMDKVSDTCQMQEKQ
jgi:hypothetical protein